MKAHQIGIPTHGATGDFHVSVFLQANSNNLPTVVPSPRASCYNKQCYTIVELNFTPKLKQVFFKKVDLNYVATSVNTRCVIGR